MPDEPMLPPAQLDDQLEELPGLAENETDPQIAALYAEELAAFRASRERQAEAERAASKDEASLRTEQERSAKERDVIAKAAALLGEADPTSDTFAELIKEKAEAQCRLEAFAARIQAAKAVADASAEAAHKARIEAIAAEVALIDRWIATYGEVYIQWIVNVAGKAVADRFALMDGLIARGNKLEHFLLKARGAKTDVASGRGGRWTGLLSAGDKNADMWSRCREFGASLRDQSKRADSKHPADVFRERCEAQLRNREKHGGTHANLWTFASAERTAMEHAVERAAKAVTEDQT